VLCFFAEEDASIQYRIFKIGLISRYRQSDVTWTFHVTWIFKVSHGLEPHIDRHVGDGKDKHDGGGGGQGDIPSLEHAMPMIPNSPSQSKGSESGSPKKRASEWLRDNPSLHTIRKDAMSGDVKTISVL
jgi:hypothetical protein